MFDVLLHNMFALQPTVLEKVLRPILVYGFLVIGLRLAGKRELAQLNPFDLIVLLTLSNTVQNAIIGDDVTVTGGMIGAATLLIVNYVVVGFLYRHERIERLIEGAPDKLIEAGQVRMDRLQTELITLAELEMAAHKQGFTSLSDVAEAVLEPGGALTFVGKQPLPEQARHQELLARLAALQREVISLRTSLGGQ